MGMGLTGFHICRRWRKHSPSHTGTTKRRDFVPLESFEDMEASLECIIKNISIFIDIIFYVSLFYVKK